MQELPKENFDKSNFDKSLMQPLTDEEMQAVNGGETLFFCPVGLPGFTGSKIFPTPDTVSSPEGFPSPAIIPGGPLDCGVIF
ncbi:MAG: hypothetical protein QNJ49_13305 [Mastigocoleus sp. MO_167.B18]|uniref:hypothetical protein n=1 Tax=Mastigocoleus sp. MO_188.B34 TaxID=3036635 RepID=UPI0026170D2A|nr:hypothetical protein [Mastigocoleus sp. MO_188.B34]MDJ0693698.1 hypothetical protein [Mastigocoleus sp. MO_188.B34]MDJ0774376.1 hypothetical protein [Mastigocoleus sp. MO_167.B18]